MDQLPRDRFDEYRGSQREVRTGLSRFCEQLALLDGGTIALVATNAVSHSGQLRHRYTLAVGLGFLAIGLIGLLLRNLAETERIHISP